MRVHTRQSFGVWTRMRIISGTVEGAEDGKNSLPVSRHPSLPETDPLFRGKPSTSSKSVSSAMTLLYKGRKLPTKFAPDGSGFLNERRGDPVDYPKNIHPAVRLFDRPFSSDLIPSGKKDLHRRPIGFDIPPFPIFIRDDVNRKGSRSRFQKSTFRLAPIQSDDLR